MKLTSTAGLFLTAVALAFGGARFMCHSIHSRPVLFDMTAVQKAQVDHLHGVLLARTSPLKRELGQARGELMALLRQPDPDKAAVEAKLREITRLEDAIQREFVQHLLRMKKVLTPAQQERLFRTMGERLSLPAPGAPPHGGPASSP
jgi:Spy/CpxP family protein refolding chaperone